ncbi:MAG: alpha-1,2-fucosyltransferase [Lachnospiraceae bacterium]|nr:alpha-1,2-fucosyltransferase [Lachnospiraceae bacterium]
MIILRFTSGLGNQMFQYAFYTFLKKRYPESSVKADLTWFSWHNEHQGWELEKLFMRPDNPGFTLESASPLEIFRCSGAFPQTKEWVRYPNRLLRIFTGRHFEKCRIEESGHHDAEETYRAVTGIKEKENRYITGFFLDERYYADSLDSLKTLFSFDINRFGKKNLELARQIVGTVSVSIHVRRGDYLSDTYKNDFVCLGRPYYKSAVAEIRKRLDGEATFFIFSDDKEFIKREFEWLPRKVIVEGNEGKNSWKDMALMTFCKGNIIANSTFSIWGALLNRHPGAPVIYPKAYLTDQDNAVSSVPGWIRL